MAEIKVGDVRTLDAQASDICRQYRVVAKNADGTWTCEYLPVTDAQLSEMEGRSYYSEEDILREIEDTGLLFKTRFVSSEAYAAHF